MANRKEIALHDRVEFDGTDISNLVRSVERESSQEQVDASGFSESGRDEFLAGSQTQSITFDIFGGGTDTHKALIAAHEERTVVWIEWQADGLLDSTRETLVGNALLIDYPTGSTRKEVRTTPARFVPADENGFYWINT